MLRQAWSEVRHHPGRFLSTIIAIAISVAFLAGSAVLVATEGQAQGKAMNVSLAEADAVVTDGSGTDGVGKAIASVPGVAVSAPVLTMSEAVTAGVTSEWIDFVNVPPDGLRWASLTAGRWPSAANEVALSGGAARALGRGVGDELTLSGRDLAMTVVGVTNEPSGLFVKTGYASDAAFAAAGHTTDHAPQWAVRAAPGVSADALVDDLNVRLKTLGPDLRATSAAEVRAAAIAELAEGFDAFANVLWGFAGVALIVGMITIANTFTITLAQRRRQIGLLRAVGASGAQVRRRFLVEAVLLGVLGALLGLVVGIGLAAGVSAWSTALFWGLVLPWQQLAIAFGLGVLATVVAAFVPILRGTRVAPLEALQPVPESDERRRASLVRAVACGLFLLAGAGLAVLAVVRTDPNALLIAIGAGALLSIGVLFGGPLFVPALLKASGRAFRWTGAVPRLAADNAERNPRRATATATALMLAVGLMVTLQVSTASVRLTVLDELAAHYPVDLQVQWTDDDGDPARIPAETSDELARVSGVDASVLLSGGNARIGDDGVVLLGYDPAIPAVTGVTTAVPDDVVLVSDYQVEGMPATVTVKGAVGSVELRVLGSRLVSYEQAMVSAATLTRIVKPVPHAVMWLSVPDRGRAIDVMVAVNQITGSGDRVSGTIVQAALYEQVLNILLAITTGLLGVAVLIALIGVSNTLGLSVMERTRESALLRALGLQARSLRVMLLIEAVQVAVVGIAVGLVAGTFFGWLAVTSLGRTSGFDSIRFAVDLPMTTGMVAVAVLAAALASVLPGRRAAKAAPTEALADI
ncbi:MAG: ABC transporter permease [Propionibacteriaceae bacterium]|nr:ABC transporter permease [Propionibacteriaceae bacterium]